MNFREKIETATLPLVSELRSKLGSLPTLDVLNYYQLRIDAVQTDKSHVPDGFMFKWRYLWALLLSNHSLEGKARADSEFGFIDKLIEEIFDIYGFGALQEPGRHPGSEEEFLTRLGLGLRVREPDVIAFPEQIQKWALARLQPFDDSYFLPVYGLRFEDILAWIAALIDKTESRLNACVQELADIYADAKQVHAEFVKGKFTIEDAKTRMLDLEIGESLERNASKGESVHIFSIDELECSITKGALQGLLKQFGFRPGEIGSGYTFPHDENPLEYKTFVALPGDRFYFFDPANAYRVAAKTFEREILADSFLRDRYLKKRDRLTERWVTDSTRKVFPGSETYSNYYLEKGGLERDLLVRHSDAIVIVESKNSRLRPFKGSGDDLLKFQEDFKNSIQFAYDQAFEVKRRILEHKQTTFHNESGKPYFSIKRDEIKRIYIICVTVTPRGPFGTDLSYELKKPDTEPYPLALKLFDLDTICKHFDHPKQFIAYLSARERMHGRVCTGDELNFAGYFLKFGNLDFKDGTFLGDDFSGVFDRRWYKEKGIDVQEPIGPPVQTTMVRRGDRVTIQHGSGRKETRLVGPANRKAVKRMKGSMRNSPCPCGSGHKFKHCHGA